MPRVQINFEKVRQPEVTKVDIAYEDLPASARYVGDALLHVTWSPASRGAHVQVALEVPLGYAALALEHPNGNQPDTTFLYSPPLDRAMINDLIRALKRARTSAYGE